MGGAIRLGLAVAAHEVPNDLPDAQYLDAVRTGDEFGFFAQALTRAAEEPDSAEHLVAAVAHHRTGRQHLARTLRLTLDCARTDEVVRVTMVARRFAVFVADLVAFAGVAYRAHDEVNQTTS